MLKKSLQPETMSDNNARFHVKAHSRLQFLGYNQRYTYRVLQTIQMKLILLCVWAEPAGLGSTKTAPKNTYEIEIG